MMPEETRPTFGFGPMSTYEVVGNGAGRVLRHKPTGTTVPLPAYDLDNLKKATVRLRNNLQAERARQRRIKTK